ncbi:MAG: 50S ribosomal protein L15 [Deltaproteobacteria bacterium]|nr:50S ribosomal protein L15 [Deltaproteobacteria bacterium]
MNDILSKLSPPEGARKKRKRIGRGPGSGWGKTAGKGMNGQKARSGGGIARGFEGGQMPLQRRMPKRGFTNIFKKEIIAINVELLDVFSDGDVVDVEALGQKGLISKVADGVKILGKGELTRKLTVRLHNASAGAIEKIQKAGGSFEQISLR